MIDFPSLYRYTLPLGLPEALPAASTNADDLTRGLPAGFYSTFRTFGGARRVIGLSAHLARLYGPARERGITPALAQPALRAEIARLLAAFAPGEARVRLVLSASARPGTLYILLQPLTPLSAQVYQQGVWVLTSASQRNSPTLKSSAFITQSAAERQRIAESGAFEGLIVVNGNILEGLTSNFYAVQHSTLYTASRGILHGVTRTAVLRLARRAGISIRYQPVPLGGVGQVDEAFLTSSSRGIVPIVRVDAISIGPGAPGPLTRQLMAAYETYVARAGEVIAPPPTRSNH